MKQLFLFKDMEETKNQKGYTINEQGRECSVCMVFKLWECFRKSKNTATGYDPRCRGCKDKVNSKAKAKVRICPERRRLFDNMERKYTKGDERSDGKVFLSYDITRSKRSNFEVWVAKETLEKIKKTGKKNRDDRAKRFSKIERKYKRGYVREDGLKFWRYACCYEATNFEKWVTDAEFDRLKFNTTKKSYMNKSLGKFGGKDEPTDEIVGLNNHDLSCYIESLFEEGMTWKNRGNWEGKWNSKKPKWHLDHIIPLDAANTLEETKHLWHYTNLRPMWGNENLAKSNKHCPKEFTAFLAERRAADE